MWAEFIPTESGRILLTYNGVKSNSATLLVPPFADEMNKSRATFNKIAVEGKCYTVLPDMFGTGDSEGEFHEASIENWFENLDSVVTHLESKSIRITRIVALRFGCLLAASWLANRDHLINELVLCQPVLNGQLYLRQLLRLANASGIIGQGSTRTVEQLLDDLSNGLPINSGGYEISPALALAIKPMILVDMLKKYLERLPTNLSIVEVKSNPLTGLSKVNQDLVDELSNTCSVSHGVIEGDPFWMSTEIVCNRALARKVGSC